MRSQIFLGIVNYYCLNFSLIYLTEGNRQKIVSSLAKELITMHPADRQAALKKAGLTQAEFSRRIGRAQATVSDVIRDLRTSDYIRREFCKAIGKEPWEVFPNNYKKAA